jgi:hypothetical protein
MFGAQGAEKTPKGNPILYVGERLSYSARVWEGKLPAGHCLINLHRVLC